MVPAGEFSANCFRPGWVARAMGLPILRILVATNENDAIDVFFRTGVYAPRPVSETVATSSPSMDISRAASFERFLLKCSDATANALRELMTELETNGRFELTKEEFNKISSFRTHGGHL
mgnify:CR=1 FL=1